MHMSFLSAAGEEAIPHRLPALLCPHGRPLKSESGAAAIPEGSELFLFSLVRTFD